MWFSTEFSNHAVMLYTHVTKYVKDPPPPLAKPIGPQVLQALNGKDRWVKCMQKMIRIFTVLQGQKNMNT